MDNILKINKIKNRVKKNIKKINNSPGNSIDISQKSLFHNNNNTINKKNVLENIKNSYLEKSDYEISILTYEEALIQNKQIFLDNLFSSLNAYFILLFVFKKQKKNDFDSKIIKICYFLFLVILYFTINTLFVDMTSFHNIYLNKGNSAIGSNINKIIYATLISYILQKIFTLAIFTHSTVIKIKNCEVKNRESTIKDVFYIVTIKCLLFFCLTIIMSILFLFYAGCFGVFFRKTQIYLFLSTIISIIISFLFSFIILVISVVIRVYSLSKPNRVDLYKSSQILQMI